jgi:hypothetical protein
MAKREITVYTCDRCGSDIDPAMFRPPVRAQRLVPIVHPVTGEATDGLDLCPDCTALFRAFMDGGDVVVTTGLSEAARSILKGFTREISTGPPREVAGGDVSVTVSPPPPVGAVGQALLDAQRRAGRTL